MADQFSIVCQTHGEQSASAVCPHLLQGTGKGWHMLGSGDDKRPDAICFGCVDAWPPDLSAEEAGIDIAVICSRCYDDLRVRHDVARADDQH